jgi:hypothetical protein
MYVVMAFQWCLLSKLLQTRLLSVQTLKELLVLVSLAWLVTTINIFTIAARIPNFKPDATHKTLATMFRDLIGNTAMPGSSAQLQSRQNAVPWLLQDRAALRSLAAPAFQFWTSRDACNRSCRFYSYFESLQFSAR